MDKLPVGLLRKRFTDLNTSVLYCEHWHFNLFINNLNKRSEYISKSDYFS